MSAAQGGGAQKPKVLAYGAELPEGCFPLHSRFHRVLNFTWGPWLLSLVEPPIGASCFNIVLDRLPDISEEVELCLEVGLLRLGTLCLDLPAERIYTAQWTSSSNPLLLHRGLQTLRRTLEASQGLPFPECLGMEAPSRKGFEGALEERLDRGLKALMGPEFLEGISLLKGCGWGLTPSGDDLLAGYLYALHVLQVTGLGCWNSRIQEVAQAAGTDNPFSATGLEMARLGHPFEPMRSLMEALAWGSEERVVHHTKQLLGFGATSGTDLATGLCLGLEWGMKP